MKYDIQLRRIEKTPVLFVRKETPVSGIGVALGSAYTAIWPFAERHGIHPNGAPYARYLSVTPERAVFEAGVPVPTPLEGEGEIESGELPGCEAAVTMHIGPYDAMEPAYEAVRAWIREHDRAEGGAPWEVYHSDPASEPDPAKWRTEVVWPLA